MNQSYLIASLISIVACLVLAMRGLRGVAMPKAMAMGLAWLGIIVALYLVVDLTGLRLG